MSALDPNPQQMRTQGSRVVIRQPKFMVFVGLLYVPIGLERAWGLKDTQSAVGVAFDLALVAGALLTLWHFVVRYWATSIVVTPETIIFKQWRDAASIATSSFVAIRRKSFGSGPVVVLSNGEIPAPWYHPNLTEAVDSALLRVRAAV